MLRATFVRCLAKPSAMALAPRAVKLAGLAKLPSATAKFTKPATRAQLAAVKRTSKTATVKRSSKTTVKPTSKTAAVKGTSKTTVKRSSKTATVKRSSKSVIKRPADSAVTRTKRGVEDAANRTPSIEAPKETMPVTAPGMHTVVIAAAEKQLTESTAPAAVLEPIVASVNLVAPEAQAAATAAAACDEGAVIAARAASPSWPAEPVRAEEATDLPAAALLF